MKGSHPLNKSVEFHNIYKAHWKALYVYAFNILRDKETSEDVIQEIFVDLWSRMEITEVSDYKAYLYQAVRFQCAKIFKKGNVFSHFHEEQLEMALALVAEESEPENYKEDLAAYIFEKANKVLPAQCYHVFELRFNQHLTTKEIANQLRISVSTVENHINKALKILKQEDMYEVRLLALIMLFTDLIVI